KGILLQQDAVRELRLAIDWVRRHETRIDGLEQSRSRSRIVLRNVSARENSLLQRLEVFCVDIVKLAEGFPNQVRAMAADIAHADHHVARQLALDLQSPHLDDRVVRRRSKELEQRDTDQGFATLGRKSARERRRGELPLGRGSIAQRQSDAL